MNALADLDAFITAQRPRRRRPSDDWLLQHPEVAEALYRRWRDGVDATLLFAFARAQGYPCQYAALTRSFRDAREQGRATFCGESRAAA